MKIVPKIDESLRMSEEVLNAIEDTLEIQLTNYDLYSSIDRINQY